MEWIEISARTVDEAKDLLLDQLGVDETEAEFEVVEEPRAGLFGRVRGEARVKARLLPKEVRGREPRQKRQRGGSNGGSSKGAASKSGGSKPRSSGAPASKDAEVGATDYPQPAASGSSQRPAREERGPRTESTVDPATLVPVLTEFLEGVVESFGLTAKVQVVVDEGVLLASIDGEQLGQLIGPRGAVVDAIQELARTVAQKNSDGPAPRLRVDVGGYRAGRTVALEAFVTEVAAQAMETGRVYVLDPMGSAERKLVHDTVAAIDGVGTSSEGEDPSRRVVITRQ